MAVLTVFHPEACPGCGAAVTASVDPSVDTPGDGVTSIPLVAVRAAAPTACCCTVHLRRGLANYPTHCGSGEMLVLVARVAWLEFDAAASGPNSRGPTR